MSAIRLSIIVPYLNSHELVRRQILHLQQLSVPNEVEIIYVDDGSDPPLALPPDAPSCLSIWPTHETRPWTSSLARNRCARERAKGEYYFMVDGDYVLTQDVIDRSLAFDGQRLGYRRQLCTLDENGNVSQEPEELERWGVLPRFRGKCQFLGAHPNSFTIRKDVFWRLGGYDEEIILNRPYPQGEDMYLKRAWAKARIDGWAKDPETDIRPTLLLLPNGQFCGDVDSNPFNLFHALSRKTARNHWYQEQLKEQQK